MLCRHHQQSPPCKSSTDLQGPWVQPRVWNAWEKIWPKHPKHWLVNRDPYSDLFICCNPYIIGQYNPPKNNPTKQGMFFSLSMSPSMMMMFDLSNFRFTSECCHISKKKWMICKKWWDKSGKAEESSIPGYPKKNKKGYHHSFLTPCASKISPIIAWCLRIWVGIRLRTAHFLFFLAPKTPHPTPNTPITCGTRYIKFIEELTDDAHHLHRAMGRPSQE